MNLQILIGRLVRLVILSQSDLFALRETGLDVAKDFGKVNQNPEVGERMAREVDAWWDATEAAARI